MTTLDRQTLTSGLLTLPNGVQYDVYGDNWIEMKAEARAIAETLGIEIDVFNSELPEA